MAKLTYPAMLEPAEGGGFGVSFPDLPGCISFGHDAAHTIRQAEEALSLHLEGMAEDGDPLPEPTSQAALGDLMLARISQHGGHLVTWALITVEGPDDAERVNVYLPKSLLGRIDAFTRTAGLNRSNFFGLAARAYMSESDPRRGSTGKS